MMRSADTYFGRDSELDRRRRAEREKYRALRTARPSYGSSNHGRGALDLVASWAPTHVVDLGCGDNAFLRELKARLQGGVACTGVDFAHEGADLMAPMHKLPLEDNCADVITSFDALEHLLPEDVDAALAEMYRIAKPALGPGPRNARFIFSIATRPSRILAPDGSNLHPTVKPREWWLEKICAARGLVRNIEEARAGGYITGIWVK